MIGTSERRTISEGHGANPTIVHGVLRVTGWQPAELLDITGRRVVDLRPEVNDVRHFSPDICFVRREGTSTTTKVVVQK